MPRQKNYFSESEVAHKWAHQTRDAAYRSGKNHFQIYFEGKTIYSYGRHFPIAVLFGKKNEFVAFTTRGYSNTTAGHIQTVRGAISHFPKENIVRCQDPDSAVAGNHYSNLMDFERQAKDSAEHLGNARKPEKYFSEIAYQKSLFDHYCKMFKVKVKAKDFPNLHIEPNEDTIKAIKARQKKEAEAKAKRDEAQAKVELIRLEAWKACKTYKEVSDHPEASNRLMDAPTGLKNTYLRVYNGNIETTKGIKFSVDAGKRFFGILRRLKEAGGCDGNCGDKKILDYKITSVNGSHVVIGCHDITWNEIDSIAKQLNWK